MIPGGKKEKPASQRRGLEIRAATGADADGLSVLLEESGGAWPVAAVADRVEAIRAGAGTVLIALDWGPPVGLVALHWFASLHAARPVAQIDLLLVGMHDRRKGIGRLLVKAASQAARVAECGQIDLSVGKGQDGLMEFCLATGFIEAGRCWGRALRKSAG